MPNTSVPVRLGISLIHRRTNVRYDLITVARHVETDDHWCIYKSTQPSVDKATGRPLPAGQVWARDVADTIEKFQWSLELKLK